MLRSSLFRALGVICALASPLCASAADLWDPVDDVPAGATNLSINSTSVRSHGPHTVGQGDPADWFRVYLTSGAQYTFHTEGGTGDTVGELYDESGNLIAYSDDNGTDLNFRIGVYGGDKYYRLKVRSYGTVLSTYDLKYQADWALDSWDPGDNTRQGATILPSPTLTAQAHGPHTLKLPEDQDDWFKVSLVGGKKYRIGAVESVFPSVTNAAGAAVYYDYTLKVYIPPVTGDYYIQVRTYQSSPSSYTLRYYQYSYDYPGDLELLSADYDSNASAEVNPGDFLDAKWTVGGDSTENHDIYLEFFASKNGGFSHERLGGTVTFSPFFSHSDGTVAYSRAKANHQYWMGAGHLINQIPDGMYTLVALLNRKGTSDVGETTYTNNRLPIGGKRLFVRNPTTPVADFAWQTSLTITRNANSVTVNGTIVNQGAGASPSYGFWTEIAYGTLNQEGIMTVAGFLGGKHTSALGAGATAAYQNTVNLPAGNWAVAAIIDSTSLVPEPNERNNYAIQGTPPVTSGNLDLEILSASVSASQLAPAQVASGSTLMWTCTVRNNSAVNSGPVWFELFPSTSGGLDIVRSGNTFTVSEQRSVAAGQTQTFTFTQPLNAVTNGIYSLVAVVNRSSIGGPAESNHVNNRVTMAGRVFRHSPGFSQANLVWSVGPTIVTVDNTVTVTGTVQNTGTAATGPFWTELFRGTFDEYGTYYPKGTLGAGSYSAGLAAGATMSFSQARTLPAGNWIVGVLADSTDLVPEIDETDNYDYLQP